MKNKLPKAVWDEMDREQLAGRAMRLALRLTERNGNRLSLHLIGIFGLRLADRIISKRGIR